MAQKEASKINSDRLKMGPDSRGILTSPDGFVLNVLDVKNFDFYDIYQKMRNSYWFTSGRLHKTSQGSQTIDLLATMHASELKYLPEEEQNIINAKRLLIRRLYSRLIYVRYRAVGHKSNEVPTVGYDSIMIEHRRSEIIELFSKMYSIDEVHEICLKDWKLEVTKTGLELFRKDNIEKITELNQDYIKNYSNLRLGYKKSRLEELTWLYQDTKKKYQETDSKEEKKFLLQILKEIKQEVEGDLIRIEGDVNINIETTLNAHIQNEVLKKVPIMNIILGRAAMRSGLNPLFLLHRLQTSYYANFSGFLPSNDVNMTEDEPEYPSEFVYQLDELEKMNEAKIIEDKNTNKKMEITTTLSEKELDASSKLKRLLMQKLMDRQKDIKESQERTKDAPE